MLVRSLGNRRRVVRFRPARAEISRSSISLEQGFVRKIFWGGCSAVHLVEFRLTGIGFSDGGRHVLSMVPLRSLARGGGICFVLRRMPTTKGVRTQQMEGQREDEFYDPFAQIADDCLAVARSWGLPAIFEFSGIRKGDRVWRSARAAACSRSVPQAGAEYRLSRPNQVMADRFAIARQCRQRDVPRARPGRRIRRRPQNSVIEHMIHVHAMELSKQS
jgi:hypothetical protein